MAVLSVYIRKKSAGVSYPGIVGRGALVNRKFILGRFRKVELAASELSRFDACLQRLSSFDATFG